GSHEGNHSSVNRFVDRRRLQRVGGSRQSWRGRQRRRRRRPQQRSQVEASASSFIGGRGKNAPPFAKAARPLPPFSAALFGLDESDLVLEVDFVGLAADLGMFIVEGP